MAFPPYQNRLYGHAWFRFTPNSTVTTANIQVSDAQLAGENISSLAITQIFSSGPFQVARVNSSATTVLFSTYNAPNSSFHYNFAGSGTSLSEVPTGNIQITTTASGQSNSFILIQVNKQSTANGTNF